MEREQQVKRELENKAQHLNQIGVHLTSLTTLLDDQKLMLDVLAAWETVGTPDFEHLNSATNKITGAVDLIKEALLDVEKAKGL